MTKYALEVDNNTFALIQSYSMNNNVFQAKIGFIHPQVRILEYVHLLNWKPTYKGSTKAINDWLKSTYEENSLKIKKRILSIDPKIELE